MTGNGGDARYTQSRVKLLFSLLNPFAWCRSIMALHLSRQLLVILVELIHLPIIGLGLGPSCLSIDIMYTLEEGFMLRPKVSG